MLVTTFPNLSTSVNICLTLPGSTASVEQRENCPNHLMLIAIESSNELSEH